MKYRFLFLIAATLLASMGIWARIEDQPNRPAYFAAAMVNLLVFLLLSYGEEKLRQRRLNKNGPVKSFTTLLLLTFYRLRYYFVFNASLLTTVGIWMKVAHAPNWKTSFIGAIVNLLVFMFLVYQKRRIDKKEFLIKQAKQP